MSSIVDVKRDGNAVLSAVVERVSMSRAFSNQMGSNDHAISIFKQEQFLKDVISLCKVGKEQIVIDSLNAVRSALLNDNAKFPSFIRIGIPYEFSLLRNNSVSTCKEIATEVANLWNSEYMKFGSLGTKKRKSKADSDNDDSSIVAFPFPRKAFSFDQMEKSFSKALLVPVAGLSTSYLSQIVPCDLFKSPKHRDYFPTVLLAEMLSKAEGPLYMGIRGQG